MLSVLAMAVTAAEIANRSPYNIFTLDVVWGLSPSPTMPRSFFVEFYADRDENGVKGEFYSVQEAPC